MGRTQTQPYEVYDQMDFDIPRPQRRLLRPLPLPHQRNAPVRPHHQQCSDWLKHNPGPVITGDHKVAPPKRTEMKMGMEDLIHHFKLFTEGMHVPEGETYTAVEHPKGEFGVYIISDAPTNPTA